MKTNRKQNIKIIHVDLEDRFVGIYKGHRISIIAMADDGLDIEVIAPDGRYAVNTVKDFDTITEAIDFAMDQAGL